MIKYILFCILVLTLITLYLGYKRETPSIFKPVTAFFLLVVAFSVLYCFAIALLELPDVYLELMPFGFIYGPVLYYTFCLIKDNRPGKSSVFLHLVPFFAAVVFFLINISTDLLRNLKSDFVYETLLSVFMGTYALKVILDKFDLNENYKTEYELIRQFSWLALVTSAIRLVIALLIWDNEKGDLEQILLSTINIMLLISVILLLKYTLYHFFNAEAIVVKEDHKQVKAQTYKKSTLSEQQLDRYERELYAIMIKQMVFLDESLSLQVLAKQLKMPKHHLTQLLSVRIGENFYHYINRFRIDYACKLINQSARDLTLEELAYKSGFNSKTSFNRYFKKELRCTPSEYRNL